MRQNLYNYLKSQREDSHHHPNHYNRIMLVGYFNEQQCKKRNLDIEKFVADSLRPFLNRGNQPGLTGYLYLKGHFYIHFLESTDINMLNSYLKSYQNLASEQFPELHVQLKVVHQTYESQERLFGGWDCDNNQQTGPILTQTDKLEEQIQDRMLQIHDFFEDGARRKRQNPAHRIGNMILLNTDDMSLLISESFMSLEEYGQLYWRQLEVQKEAELNYPLPSGIFQMIEFMETPEYKNFAKNL